MSERPRDLWNLDVTKTLCGLALALTLSLLGACSGGDDPPPPPASEGSATVDSTGGTVQGPDGVVLTLPDQAVTTGTTFRIARDSTGAPPLVGMTLLSPIYAITPHGTELDRHGTLTLPYDASKVPAGGKIVILRGETDGTWHVQPNLGTQAGVAVADVGSLSYWVAGVCTPGDAGVFGFGIGDCPAYHDLGLKLEGFAPPFDDSALTFVRPIEKPVDMAALLLWERPRGLDRVDELLVRGPGMTTYSDLFNDANNDFYSFVGQPHLDPAAIPGAGNPNGVVVHYKATAQYCWTGFIIGRGDNQKVCWSFDADFPLKVHDAAAPPDLPVINSQPINASVVTGQVAGFSVSATANGLQVSWERQGANGSWLPANAVVFAGDGKTSSPSPDTSTFTLTANGARDNGALLRAKVCNVRVSGVSSCVPYSNTVQLIVTNTLLSSPAFTLQPQGRTVQAGETFDLSTTADGVPYVTIDLHRVQVGVDQVVKTCGPATLASVPAWPTTLPANPTPCHLDPFVTAFADDGAEFYAVARSSAGSASSVHVLLHVSSSAIAPSITTQPLAASTPVGGSAGFSVVAAGSGALSYQWSLNGTPLSDHAAGTGSAGISGAASPLLTLTNAQSADAGSYAVNVTNGLGSVTSNTVALTVTVGQPSTVGACVGDSTGWCYLQPAPVADPLSGLVIDSAAGKVYAVGVVNGTVMRSSDKGNAWAVSWDPARYNWSDLAQPASGVLVATGSLPTQGQSIFRSLDAGTTWTTVYNGGCCDVITGVTFADANVGAAVGSKVWRTVDGGATWAPVSISVATLPSGSNLYRVAYAGNNVFVAIAGTGTFLRSSDGGMTWSRVATAGTDYLVDLAFGSGGSGVAVQQAQSQVLRTSDYGATWSVVNVNLGSGSSAVAFADANTVVVMGQYSAFIRSTDGGASWTDPDHGLAGGQQNWRMRFANPSFGLAVGQYGAVARTLDGGQTWTRIAGGRLDDTIQQLEAGPGGNVTLATNLLGQVRRSTDAGLTWSDGTATSFNGPSAISFGSANAVMAFSLFGTVSLSTDTGATYTTVLDDPSVNFNSGAMASATTAIAVGRVSGSAFGTGGFMRRTTDAGASWTPVTLPSAKWLWAARFLTPRVGLVGGQDGTLLRTTDGGATWTSVEIQPKLATDTVQFIARVSDTVAIVSTDSEIKRSTDGGLTWARVHLNNGGGMRGVAFRDANTGIAVGTEILSTSNGGLTWSTLDLPLGYFVSGVAWASPTTPVMGGDGGALLRNQRSGALSVGRVTARAVRGAATTGNLLKTSR